MPGPKTCSLYLISKFCETHALSNLEVIEGGRMEAPLDCPSSQPNQPGSRVIGVITTHRKTVRMIPLRQPVPASDIIPLIPDSIPITEIVRVASPCQSEKCVHFAGGGCSLVTKIVAHLPVVSEKLAPCALRRSCRWWFQEGAAACLRCPQIITEPYRPSESMLKLGCPSEG